VDIRSLRSMLAIMETHSLNKAAGLLGISQPALTKKIQRMEAQLGVTLFERDKDSHTLITNSDEAVWPPVPPNIAQNTQPGLDI
jgi:DNA-binding transcriptional LysR family regulator